MVSKSFKVLETINGQEYTFSSFAFKSCVRKYKAEKKSMAENKMVDGNFTINMEKTKDVIRVIYQKMSGFMDAAVQEVCFENDEATYLKYEEMYKDMVGTLHKSMLDIPIDTYDQLSVVAEGDLYAYMYGFPEGPADICDLVEFHEFCDENNKSGYIAKMLFMEKKAEEFYKHMREILKVYLLA